MTFCFCKKRGIEKKYVNYWFKVSGAHISRTTEIAIVDAVHWRFFWPPKVVEGKFQCDWKGLPDTPAPDTHAPNTHMQLLRNLDEIRQK